MKAYAQTKQIIAKDNANVSQTIVQPVPTKDTISVGPVQVASDNILIAGGIVCVLIALGYFVKKLIDKKFD